MKCATAYTGDSPLLDSGFLEPVRVRIVQIERIAEQGLSALNRFPNRTGAPSRIEVTVLSASVPANVGRGEFFNSDWLPPRDSNPDMLIQSQLSYH